jgi:hypothetical protein
LQVQSFLTTCTILSQRAAAPTRPEFTDALFLRSGRVPGCNFCPNAIELSSIGILKMTKKKPKGSSDTNSDVAPVPEANKLTPISSNKAKPTTKPGPEPNVPPTLVICRNKYMALDPIRGRIPWIGLIQDYIANNTTDIGATYRPIMAHGSIYPLRFSKVSRSAISIHLARSPLILQSSSISSRSAN